MQRWDRADRRGHAAHKALASPATAAQCFVPSNQLPAAEARTTELGRRMLPCTPMQQRHNSLADTRVVMRKGVQHVPQRILPRLALHPAVVGEGARHILRSGDQGAAKVD